MNQGREREGKAAIDEFRGERSKKILKCSVEATAHMKEYFRDVREKMQQGEPVTWTCIGIPREILFAMDILYTDAVHYSALCSAKQMSRYYLDTLNNQGYFRDLCRYCTVALGCAFDRKPEIAPWGGIPNITAVIGIHHDDPIQKIWELYARELNAPLYMVDRPYYTRLPRIERWWEDQPEADAEIEPHLVAATVEEYKGLIRFLETVTGKHFSESRLKEVLERRNLQAEYRWKATDLAAGTVPCPISASDTFSNASSTTWFPGTQWLVDHSKKYYEEIKERVDKGEAACPNEKVRLYWGLYIGIWFSLGFYNAFEEKYGAIFLPAPYQAWDGRPIRRDMADPLWAMASQYVGFPLDRVPPTTGGQWFVHLAKKYKAHGTVFLSAESCKYNYSCLLFGKKRLEEAGVPALIINADMVDARDWDDAKMKSLVASFIETLMP